MRKNYRKLFLLLLVVLATLLTSCNKKKVVKHRWIEENPISTGTEIKSFGVQPQKGNDPNAPIIITAPIYIPLGMDENGKRQYDKVLVELEELKPEYIDEGLKAFGVVSDESIFGELKIVNSDVTSSAGPGATDGQVLSKKGIVRYLDLGTDLDNSDNYKDVDSNDYKKLKGKIDYTDIMYCILTTFQENYQLVDCEFNPMSEDEYYKLHPKK